ncbi:MAG TPA: hypothetical protein VGE77_00675 [Nocardioides sp.]
MLATEVATREEKRQTWVVRAHLGMRWGERTASWKEHRSRLLWLGLAAFCAVMAHVAGESSRMSFLAIVTSGFILADHGLSAVQKWRHERDDRRREGAAAGPVVPHGELAGEPAGGGMVTG